MLYTTKPTAARTPTKRRRRMRGRTLDFAMVCGGYRRRGIDLRGIDETVEVAQAEGCGFERFEGRKEWSRGVCCGCQAGLSEGLG
jgi:hypothetical protein